MKKRLISFLLMLSLWLMAIALLSAEEKAIVKVDRANIRRQPDRQSLVLIVVTKGTTLNVLGKEGEWYRISLTTAEKKTIIGYIHQDLIDIVKEETKPSKIEEKPTRPKIEAKPEPPVTKEKVFEPRKRDRGKLRAFGFKMGYSGASLYGENVEEFEEYLQYEMKTKGGLNFAGFIIVNLNKFLSLQSELNYVQKGAKTEGEVVGEQFKAWINLAYLEIPALIRFYLPSQGDFNFSLYSGTYIGLKMSGRAKAQVGEVKVEEDIENLKSTDAGLIFGASFDFSLPFLRTGRLSFDLRYSLGLTSISAEAGVETKNKVISLSLGYLF